MRNSEVFQGFCTMRDGPVGLDMNKDKCLTCESLGPPRCDVCGAAGDLEYERHYHAFMCRPCWCELHDPE